MYAYAAGIPMRFWVGNRFLTPKEELEWRPRLSRSHLLFYRDETAGVLWYSFDRWRKDLVCWERFPGLWSGDLDWRSWEETIMAVVRKRKNGKADEPRGVPVDHTALKKWPGLWEHLTAAEYPDEGGPRKTSTITFFLGQQGLTACLSDKDNGCTCFANATTLTGLLDELEAAVQNPATVWREDKLATGSSARVKQPRA